jgi:hypothetical protein
VSSASSRLPSILGRVALATTLIAASSALAVVPAAASTPATAGYRDFSYAIAAGADDATASSAQSKLWYYGGYWFGDLFDPGTASLSATFRIFRLSWPTQTWTNTGVAVDGRNRSHADVLAIGNKVYVASSHRTGELRFYSFTYNATTHSYTKDASFPTVLANTSSGTGYASLTMDATGRLWIVFTQASGTVDQSSVYYAASTNGGLTWTTPAVLPSQASPVHDEDIAVISTVTTSSGPAVGVLWSDQDADDQSFYFSAHLNTSAADSWEPRETAYGGPGTNGADNHISAKTDSAGNFLAAVKTGKVNPGDPSIVTLRRNAAGAWDAHTVATHNLDVTRPVLVINAAANRADVFVTSPTLASTGAQSIYRRSASLTTLDFGQPAVGTAVISSASDPQVNDATSTKQAIGRGWGEIVLADDVSTLFYLHAAMAAPDVDPLRQGFYVRSTLGSTTALTRLVWSAADPWGIARYRLYISTTSATSGFTQITLPSALSTAIARTLTIGKQYWFLVQAIDTQGRSSTRVTPVKILRVQQTATSIVYGGTWRTQLTTSASGGSLKFATTLKSSASYTFLGRSIGWVAWTGPYRGIANVYVDGVLAAKIDLRTSTNLPRRIVISRSWPVNGIHTIKLVLVGASGRQRMDLDAFMLGR